MVNRRLMVRTAYDILVALTVLVATGIGGWKLMRGGMGLSVWGATLVFAPTALMTVLAAVYGYAVGWQRYYLKHQHVLDFRTPFVLTSPSKQFDRRFHRAVYGMLIGIPVALGVAFGVLRDYQETLIFGVLSIGIALWSGPRLRALIDRGEQDAEEEGS